MSTPTASPPQAATATIWVGPQSEAIAALPAGVTPFLAIRYGGGDLALPCPVLDIPNAVLSGEPWLELWCAEGPVETCRRGRFEVAQAGDLLIAGGHWPLDGDLRGETHALYRELLGLAAEQGRPGLLRLWNYLPGINDDQAGLERYRLFNAGRAAAFVERFAGQAEGRFCASSAVGAPGGDLVTLLLCGRDEGHHLENPRQLPAWRYPSTYGPVSPSFARATVAPSSSSNLAGAVLVSGTASIVGHESRHHDDLLAQLDETLANLSAILERANAERRRAPRPGGRLADLDFVKVYLRHAGDLEPVRRRLAARLRPEVPVLWLQAEICRAELLLEIEGVAF